MPIVGRFGSLAGLGSLILPGGAFESIATVTVGSGGAASVEFTNIPTTYQHLQLRGTVRSTQGSSTDRIDLWLNNATGTTLWAQHVLRGEGSGAFANAYTSNDRFYIENSAPANSATASVFSAIVMDLLDYTDTNKNRVLRVFAGYDANGSGQVEINSGLYRSTSAVSSIQLDTANGFAQHTRWALYGLRAP